MPKKIRVPTDRRRQLNVQPLDEGDVIEYKVTLHADVDGVEAWVGYGNTSQVREGESSREADKRVRDHVEQQVRRRIEELGDRL